MEKEKKEEEVKLPAELLRLRSSLLIKFLASQRREGLKKKKPLEDPVRLTELQRR